MFHLCYITYSFTVLIYKNSDPPLLWLKSGSDFRIPGPVYWRHPAGPEPPPLEDTTTEMSILSYVLFYETLHIASPFLFIGTSYGYDNVLDWHNLGFKFLFNDNPVQDLHSALQLPKIIYIMDHLLNSLIRKSNEMNKLHYTLV